ncbi:Fur family transcriptional regulator [Acidomonas methanolica]|uniref:Fur family transcriptional regulator n=1 Tax=Acidomonas methanolica TaxID=437 RepID=UPI00211A9FCD|nr:transcriptional repressor [Acidomonas methanolica]MCQ9155968.1 transcriptional repressor [Acidomonas methanolica]
MDKHQSGTTDAPFPADIEARLDQAERACFTHGTRLTETRRQVLGLILAAPKPPGAYDLLEQLRVWHRNAAPPTIYRALDFLSEQGLIHKIERLSAFVPCTHRLNCDHGAECGHRAQFLICRVCGHVSELEDPDTEIALSRAAQAQGFRIELTTIEVEGLCAACRS